MRPRIAIPVPHGLDLEYAERAIVQYEHAIAVTGGEPVRIPLDQPADALKDVVDACLGVVLPGSKADVDPARFHASRSPHTTATDHAREAADNLLLASAYRDRKPVLAICYGLQSLNVYRSGSLIQHIPDFLPESRRDKVNHEAGKTVLVAHSVEIEPGSRLEEIVSNRSVERNILPVNSSHHQSVERIGEGLRVVARCPDDGIIEALEGTLPDHFVLAVQWHPERSVEQDDASPAIFQAFMKAASRAG